MSKEVCPFCEIEDYKGQRSYGFGMLDVALACDRHKEEMRSEPETAQEKNQCVVCLTGGISTKPGAVNWLCEKHRGIASYNQDSPLQTQVGGSHYNDLAIQPVEYIMKNNLNFLQGTIVKYVTRYKNKNGIEDLKKARHCIDLLIFFEETNDG